MSDKASQPVEEPDSGVNGADLLNERESPLSIIGDLSRISWRTEIANADRHPPASARKNDEETEDFVAVDHDDVSDYAFFRRAPAAEDRHSQLDDLHPFVQLLTKSNVDDCEKVEEAFPASERASREKFVYRLTKCPELSLGLFTIPRLERGKPKPPATLVGHIIATRTSSPFVTDSSIALPPDWRSTLTTAPGDGKGKENLGHQEQGSTIAIHSLAVLPEHQGKRVGMTLMRAYIQRIRGAATASRIALLAHEPLIPFYQTLGFDNEGPSSCTFGGGGWFNLVIRV